MKDRRLIGILLGIYVFRCFLKIVCERFLQVPSAGWETVTVHGTTAGRTASIKGNQREIEMLGQEKSKAGDPLGLCCQQYRQRCNK